MVKHSPQILTNEEKANTTTTTMLRRHAAQFTTTPHATPQHLMLHHNTSYATPQHLTLHHNTSRYTTTPHATPPHLMLHHHTSCYTTTPRTTPLLNKDLLLSTLDNCIRFALFELMFFMGFFCVFISLSFVGLTFCSSYSLFCVCPLCVQLSLSSVMCAVVTVKCVAMWNAG